MKENRIALLIILFVVIGSTMITGLAMLIYAINEPNKAEISKDGAYIFILGTVALFIVQIFRAARKKGSPEEDHQESTGKTRPSNL